MLCIATWLSDAYSHYIFHVTHILDYGDDSYRVACDLLYCKYSMWWHTKTG